MTLNLIRQIVAAAVIGLLVGQPGLAQGLNNLLANGKSTAPAVPSPADPLGRTNPRNSIYNFLEACHRNDFLAASEYLDLRNVKPQVRSAVGPELAKELGALLDRDPHFEVDQLSNKAEGSGGGLTANIETLATLQLKNKAVTLQMERVTQQGIGIWLVSAGSVSRIPELSSLAGESAIEKRLPEPLVATKLMDTPIWVWLALVLAALILSLVSRVLSTALLALVKPITRRYAKSLRTYRLEAFTEPLRLLVSLAVFRACMEVIAPSALLRDYLLKLITLLFVLGIALLLMRVVDIISDQVISRLDPAERALSYSVVPLIVRFVKICVFCAAVLFTLSAWGYNTNAILAGVSIGGWRWRWRRRRPSRTCLAEFR